MGVESTGTKSYLIVMNKLLPRRYKSVIYKESKIMVANSEIAQYTTKLAIMRGRGRPVVPP